MVLYFPSGRGMRQDYGMKPSRLVAFNEVVNPGRASGLAQNPITCSNPPSRWRGWSENADHKCFGSQGCRFEPCRGASI
jgi:hypothetical protein